jgi:hypothetical protein
MIFFVTFLSSKFYRVFVTFLSSKFYRLFLYRSNKFCCRFLLLHISVVIVSSLASLSIATGSSSSPYLVRVCQVRSCRVESKLWSSFPRHTEVLVVSVSSREVFTVLSLLLSLLRRVGIKRASLVVRSSDRFASYR